MTLLADLSSTWNFLMEGGFFMALLGLCSLAALTVIILKALALNRNRILPLNLERELENGQLEKEPDQHSTLGRLCSLALARRVEPDVKEAVQASAREEIVRMNSGLAILEVITTIAPLLGLLGTASGLVTVFGDLESKENIQRGIATALSTTVVGMAIAIPAVIAHGFFSRRIETYAARLEVLLGRVVSKSSS